MDWGGRLDDDEKADTGELPQPQWIKVATVVYLLGMSIPMLIGASQVFQALRYAFPMSQGGQ